MNNPSNSIDLINSLSPDHIRVNAKADNWREAVQLVGALFVKTGIADSNYTQAMIKTIEDLGPYCVISPGVAMPHARPEEGVLQTGITIATLQKPVEFGSDENDPVDIIIGLAAVDKVKHIKALKKISVLLNNDHLIESIRDAASREELFTLIKQKRNKS